MLFGLTFAVLAAVFSGTGSILQSLGVKRAGTADGAAEGVADLRKQPLYFAGLACDILGFVCSATALSRLPLFFVQSVVAASVGVTALISVLMGKRLGRAAWFALGTAGAGLVMLAVSAAPGPSTPLPAIWHWPMLLAVIPVSGVAFAGYQVERRWSAPILALAAGLCFAAVAVSARTLHLPDPVWRIILEPAAWAIAVNGGAAAVLFVLALQRGTVTTVTGVVFTTQTVVPSTIGFLVLGDQVRPGLALLALIGFLLAVGGAVALARFSAEHWSRPDLPEAGRTAAGARSPA